jgi:6-pyruvoyltetrahydropterin/6-carboxytetrahydropterin synthase
VQDHHGYHSAMHPPSAPRYRLVLAKEDFKFSAAHFTLLPESRAELLHGHNYRVQLELIGTELDQDGLLIDVERLKKSLRAACARLDSRTLLPAESTRLDWREAGTEIEVHLDERRYLIPRGDVLMLPLANTSMELLAGMLWRELIPQLAGGRIEWFSVSVEEAAGQRCCYEGPVG